MCQNIWDESKYSEEIEEYDTFETRKLSIW